MNPQDFADCMRREIIEHNLSTYDDLLAAPPDRGTDENWRTVLRAYSTMTEDQRACLRITVRQAMIDTMSNILGVLDGTSLLENYREDFVLKYGASGQKLNGDLRDYFLADLEDNP